MNFKLRNLVAATLAGSFLMGFGANAMADSTTDIVNALVSKGVLTEEEGALLTKGRTEEAAGQAKALKKASKLKVSDAIDNAELYGDIRVRGESRTAKSGVDNYDYSRARLKATLGIKTESGKFYSDLAVSSGGSGRSDNWNMGTATTTAGKGEVNTKQGVNIKRAMIGYKATDWLTLEAGRLNNPLYTTPMVWDADLTPDAIVEKFNFKLGDTNVFVTGMQNEYLGSRLSKNGVVTNTAVGTNTGTTELIATQAGFSTPLIADVASIKAAATYTFYTKNIIASNYKASVGTNDNAMGVNDLTTWEIPAEVNYFTNNIGFRVYGDYVVNVDADQRANNFNGNTAGAGNEDYAWLVGFKVASAKDLKAFEGNKMKTGDWQGSIWYQATGLYALDNNLVDSDYMDSRVNMKGTILKGTYMAADNLAINFAYGHGTPKNNALQTNGYGDMGGIKLDKFDLLQLDATYKF
jgi:polyhydroxyalkanoate synthesis regulator phasin